MRYILASKSPRRSEILKNLGVDFTVITADTDEACELRDPAALTEELALRKGLAVCEMLKKEDKLTKDDIVISADTVVACGGKILGKPHSREDAYEMLKLLSGRSHEVISAISLIRNGISYTSHSATKVFFNDLSEKEINTYIDSNEPYDKAGAYAIQGKASMFINKIEGCYFGVVGLSVDLFNKLHEKCTGTRYSEQ